jgi:hypothetical protein
MYGMLLIHSQRIAFSEGVELAKVDLGYFTQALSDIGTAAPTRLLLIVQTFAFLGAQSHPSALAGRSRKPGTPPQSRRSRLSGIPTCVTHPITGPH